MTKTHYIETEANDRLIAATADLLAALTEAIDSQSEDTECLQGPDPDPKTGERAGPCPDRRCKLLGCMVARVNRWRAAIAKATGET